MNCDNRKMDDAALRVLVIDPLDATRTVVETMLARRGMQIATTARRDEGLRLAREFHPDVVVLDGDFAKSNEADDSKQSFESTSAENPPSLVLIGHAKKTTQSGVARYLQKPYLYGALIHTIEELLEERRAA